MGTEIRAPKEKLETEGCGCNDLTFCAPEAAIGLEATGNILTIEQIVDVHSKAGSRHTKACQIIFYNSIHYSCATHFKSVRRITIAGTNKTTTCSQC